jgi:hypothetical protein
MAAPDFSAVTVQMLGFRSGLICNNPKCATITVGPSDAVGALALKLGEAAHIRAARAGEARYDASMTDDQRAAIDNGIWLCANCHTMIDKNKGVDFPTDELFEWKSQHEAVIRSLLLTHRSPLPILRRLTEEGQVAQEVIDILEPQGALFVHRMYEVDSHVMTSIERTRTELKPLIRKIKYDSQLKDLIKDLAEQFRDFMNVTGNFSSHGFGELQALRNRVGVFVRILQQDYGCKVRGPLSQIIPA